MKDLLNSGDSVSDVSSGDEDKAAQTYLKKIKNRLLECSKYRWPVLPSRLSKVADTLAPLPHAHEVAGLTARLAEVRNDFLNGLLFGPDNTPVPLKQRLPTETVCPPGVCKLKAHAYLKHAQAELEQSVVEFPVGGLFEVADEYQEEGFAPCSFFLAKALQTEDALTFVEVRRDHLGSLYFPPALALIFCFPDK